MSDQKIEKKWFLKLIDWENGIPGASNASASVELMSFNHGVGAWDPAQPAQMQEMSLAFYSGPLVGPLMEKCMKQKPFEKVVVELTHVRNKEQTFQMRYELFEVSVTSVNVGGSAHGDEPMPPYCSLSLKSKEVKVTCVQPDGTTTVNLKA